MRLTGHHCPTRDGVRSQVAEAEGIRVGSELALSPLSTSTLAPEGSNMGTREAGVGTQHMS